MWWGLQESPGGQQRGVGFGRDVATISVAEDERLVEEGQQVIPLRNITSYSTLHYITIHHGTVHYITLPDFTVQGGHSPVLIE
jgi:hypothetical protein